MATKKQQAIKKAAAAAPGQKTPGEQKVLELLIGVLKSRPATLGELQVALSSIGEDANTVVQSLINSGCAVLAGGGVAATRDASGNWCCISGQPPAAVQTPQPADPVQVAANPPPPPPLPQGAVAQPATSAGTPPWAPDDTDAGEDGEDDTGAAILAKLEEIAELLKILVNRDKQPAGAPATVPQWPTLGAPPPSQPAQPLPPPAAAMPPPGMFPHGQPPYPPPQPGMPAGAFAGVPGMPGVPGPGPVQPGPYNPYAGAPAGWVPPGAGR